MPLTIRLFYIGTSRDTSVLLSTLLVDQPHHYLSLYLFTIKYEFLLKYINYHLLFELKAI